MAFTISCQTKVYTPWSALRRSLLSRIYSELNSSTIFQPSSSKSTAPNSSNSMTFPHPKQNDPTTNRRNAKNSSSKRILTTYAEDGQTMQPGKITFDHFTREQMDRARRSLLVRFAGKSPNIYDETYAEVCKQLRAVDISIVQNGQNSSPVVHSPDGLRTFFLLETTSKEALYDFIQYHARSASSDSRLQPCRSRIVHFTGDLTVEFGVNSIGSRFDRIKTPGKDLLALNKAMKECIWLDEQMRVLVDETSLNEHDTRLRFFVASLIEDAFRGIFPFARCTPFGSTTNGFGHSNCDLDMDFAVEDPLDANGINSNFLCAFRVKDEDTRRQTQRMVELLHRMVRVGMPYCVDVVPIVHARVPIVKFTHDAGGFGCDVTAYNESGPTCSKILWVYNRLDDRSAALVFAIRRWAAACNITQEQPGAWLTNFQLLCLVVYFLQTHPRGPILPPIRTLRRLASSNESHGIIGDPERLAVLLGTEERKIRTPNIGNGNKTNQESVSDLLREFLRFYANEFAFDKFGLSLEHGACVDNSDNSPIFMPNPLETGHNIARNVSAKELDRFRSYARMALKIMETKELMERKWMGNRKFWGLLALFDSSLYKKDAQPVEHPVTSESGVLLVDDLEIDIQERRAGSKQNRTNSGSQKK